ncbi:hypothetical protein K7432_004293 [Basidiobolus ranarum]|uniref:MHD domain-containing protein n=1 Tax=Basidiobolus ranarum TaxID=34480 RepID=A0ABR2W5T5_9FUNG
MRYVDVFLNDRPKESFDLLSNRLKKAKVLNEEVADFFKERALIEETYSKALLKLVNKKFVSDKTTLGTLGAVWGQIVHEVQETSNLHTDFGKKILEEVAKPLRECHMVDSEWNGLKSHEASISKIIKDYDETNAKTIKHKKTAEKSSGKKAITTAKKLAESSKALEDSIQSWMHDAPALFNKYNKVDSTRLSCLKTTFSRYVELEIEQNKAQIQQHEQTLNTVLQFSIQEELDSFCANKPQNFERIVSINENAIATEPVQRSNGFDRTNTDHSDRYSQPVQSNTFNFEEPTNLAIDNSDINPFRNNGPSALPTTTVDSEGYSVPSTESTAWTQMAGEPNTLLADENEANGARMKIDIQDKVITEEPAEASKALTRVSSTLRLKNTIKRNTLRGRRDTRNRTSSVEWLERNNSNGTQIAPGTTITTSSLEARLESLDGAAKSTDANGTFKFPDAGRNTLARRDSVMPRLSMFPSNLSLSSGNSEHTGTSETNGLNGFVSEVVNVLFNNGQISKVFITGEVSISGASVNPIKIAIKDVKSFERLIPNQNFISPIDEETGIYELNIGALTQSNVSKATIFKYQLHIDEAQRSQYVPILLSSVWKCEETLTSLVVTYQANPDCLLKGSLSEASIVLPVDDNVTHVQSKPLGVWNAEKQRLLWQVADIDFNSNESQKLLARFETKTQGHPASVAAKFTHKESILSPMHFELTDVENGSVNLHYKLTTGKYIAAPGGVPSGISQ